MRIIIKNKSEIPIYEQIKEQIKSAILNGETTDNEQLPSIRQLAKDLKISVITTTRAYTDLVDEGFIISMAGKGYFVAQKNNELLKERLIRNAEDDFESAICNGRNAGLSNDELITLFKMVLEEYQ